MEWTDKDKIEAILVTQKAEELGLSPFKAGIAMGIRKIMLGETNTTNKKSSKKTNKKSK